MAITTTDTALLRLLQLSSAALPVGGYAFSQGMESAVEAGWLPDAASAREWLELQLRQSQARVDLPLLARAHAAAKRGDGTQLAYWNDYTLACRETAELRLADVAMGEALVRLLKHLEVPTAALPETDVTFVAAFAAASSHFGLDERLALHGYSWSWLESQVAAATKLVPLGQSAAQTLLGELLDVLPETLDIALDLPDEHIGASLPGLALASCWHESQYSRLFRS